MRTTNPDQSIIPVWGSIRRTGARIGSVAWTRKAEIWLRPSTSHSRNVLVAALPWRPLGDWLFSGWRLLLVLGAACASWLWHTRGERGALLRGLGLALPVTYFASVSIVFESGENMRYKFFVEPLLALLVLDQALTWLHRPRSR